MIYMQHAGGMLLPPVQKLVATIIFANGENANKSLSLRIKKMLCCSCVYFRQRRKCKQIPLTPQQKDAVLQLRLFSPTAKMQTNPSHSANKKDYPLGSLFIGNGVLFYFLPLGSTFFLVPSG